MKVFFILLNSHQNTYMSGIIKFYQPALSSFLSAELLCSDLVHAVALGSAEHLYLIAHLIWHKHYMVRPETWHKR